MQCVILAAGKGTRMLPLTETVPKPLLSVCGEPLLDHIVRALPNEVTEIILVVGYLEEQIRRHCGDSFHGRSVRYVTQVAQKGTGHALSLCRELLHGRFLFMFADDIHEAADLERVVGYERALLVCRTDTPERFGIVTTNLDGTLASIIEKPKQPSSNLASTGVMVLDTHFFDCPLTIETNGEYYVTDMITQYLKQYPIMVVEETQWIAIGYPDDLKKAEALLCPQTVILA